MIKILRQLLIHPFLLQPLDGRASDTLSASSGICDQDMEREREIETDIPLPQPLTTGRYNANGDKEERIPTRYVSYCTLIVDTDVDS